jgi:hypothetical protein
MLQKNRYLKLLHGRELNQSASVILAPIETAGAADQNTKCSSIIQVSDEVRIAAHCLYSILSSLLESSSRGSSSPSAKTFPFFPLYRQ